MLRGGGRRWWRQEAGLHIFWKKVRENLSRLSFNEFKLVTNKTLGYDIPRNRLVDCYCKLQSFPRSTSSNFQVKCHSSQRMSALRRLTLRLSSVRFAFYPRLKRSWDNWSLANRSNFPVNPIKLLQWAVQHRTCYLVCNALNYINNNFFAIKDTSQKHCQRIFKLIGTRDGQNKSKTEWHPISHTCTSILFVSYRIVLYVLCDIPVSYRRFSAQLILFLWCMLWYW